MPTDAVPTDADRCRHRRADRRAAGKPAGRVSGTAAPGTRSRGAACLRAYLLPLVPVSQSLGVSYVLAGDGALMASHAGGAPRGFDTIADAVAHAGGRTRPLLPGEILPPAAPAHGDRAPVLPVL